MACLNKVQIIGNLGADPKVNVTATSNLKVANISVGCTEKYKDQQGQQQSRTEWVRVVFFGNLAEIVEKYLHKGSQVYVEGRLQTRSYKDKDGSDKYVTEVIANEMQMLGSPTNNQSQPTQNQYAQPTQYAQQPTKYVQPTQYAQQPTKYVQPTQYAQQPTQYAQQPTQYAQQPTQYAQQPLNEEDIPF